jgi:hypothetical protein
LKKIKLIPGGVSRPLREKINEAAKIRGVSPDDKQKSRLLPFGDGGGFFRSYQ